MVTYLGSAIRSPSRITIRTKIVNLEPITIPGIRGQVLGFAHVDLCWTRMKNTVIKHRVFEFLDEVQRQRMYTENPWPILYQENRSHLDMKSNLTSSLDSSSLSASCRLYSIATTAHIYHVLRFEFAVYRCLFAIVTVWIIVYALCRSHVSVSRLNSATLDELDKR